MAEDKYAPKADDGVTEIHAKHNWLIKDQQAANKKEREESKKPKAIPGSDTKENKNAPPTQPPGSERPSNPSAEQLQPNTEEQHKDPVDVNKNPQQLPDGNQR